MSIPEPGAPVAAHPPFEVFGVLGRGGVATVYRVADPGTGSLIAWKVWHEPFDEQVRARFDVECALHATLSEHPHVTRLVARAHPAPGERPWIATELHEKSLIDWLEDHQPTSEQWRALAADLLSGLAAVHGAGHVHRDVKPANVLLRNGRWSLTDLGLAMQIGGHTQNGPAGTPYFLAPELGRSGELPTSRSDVYSVALTLLMVADRVSDPGRMPDSIDALLTRSASVHPLDRPLDARALHRQLHVAWPPVSAGPDDLPATVSTRRRARLGGLSAVVAVCLLLAGSTSTAVNASDEPAVGSERSSSAAACRRASTVDVIEHVSPPGLLEVSHLGYSVHGHISIEVSGRIAPQQRSAEPGSLWLVSFPERLPVGEDGRPGSELWYPLGTVEAGADGCFETTPLQLSSYDGAFGIMFRMGLARLDPPRRDQAAMWIAENSGEGWDALPGGVELLDTFDVDSGRFEQLDKSQAAPITTIEPT